MCTQILVEDGIIACGCTLRGIPLKGLRADALLFMLGSIKLSGDGYCSNQSANPIIKYSDYDAEMQAWIEEASRLHEELHKLKIDYRRGNFRTAYRALEEGATHAHLDLHAQDLLKYFAAGMMMRHRQTREVIRDLRKNGVKKRDAPPLHTQH